MKVLVTGGTGYIGSHTAVALIQAGYEVEILDNLFNSKETVIDRIFELTGVRPKFHKVDLLDYPATLGVLSGSGDGAGAGSEGGGSADSGCKSGGGFEAVLHFAGLKAVAESVEKPLWYYENNIQGTLNLLKAMRETGCKKMVFSSSATVYGDQGVALLDETMETGRGITNPYGQTKFMIEQILRDACVADDSLAVVLLRYFNPVGAHPSGLLGEDPNGRPNNLMPIVMKVATGEIPELSVYGDDYPTPDGTCIRDYIHVVDLARGHLAALARMEVGCEVYNLGTGRGTSVLEMISAFEKASGKKLPYKIVGRRAGDLAELCAVPEKASRELGWEAELSIDDAMRDTLNYLAKR